MKGEEGDKEREKRCSKEGRRREWGEGKAKKEGGIRGGKRRGRGNEEK
nr:hypothetical protein [Bifidobacterium breve]